MPYEPISEEDEMSKTLFERRIATRIALALLAAALILAMANIVAYASPPPPVPQETCA